MDGDHAAGKLRELAELYFAKRVSRSAAQLAYFLTLSFFPMLICVNALVGLLPLGAGEYLEVLSFVYSMAMLLIIYGMIIILVTGNWFVSLFRTRFELPAFFENWHWIRFLVLLGSLLALVYVFYRASAPRGRTAFPVFRGAAAVSVALVLVSILFSWFITLTSRYRLVYGSLAAVIVLMIWLYLCGNILIMGVVYNSTRAVRPNEGKKRENPSGG